MRKIASISLLALITSACNPTESVNYERQLLGKVSENVIETHYSNLNKNAQVLADYTFDCKNGLETADKIELQNRWKIAMGSWQQTKIIRFGPQVEQRLDWEFQFWPDKKNLVASKLKPLLKTETSIEQLQKSSVVTHGFSAMEYLLFDETPIKEANLSDHCTLIKTVSSNIVMNTSKLQQQWLLYKPEFTGSHQASEDSWNSDEYLGQIIDSLLISLEEIANQKISTPAGLSSDQGKINPYFLESWRSKHSIENIQNNLTSINEFISQGGLEEYFSHKGLTDVITPGLNAFAKTIESANKIDEPMFDAMAIQRVQLQELTDLINLTKSEIRDKWVPALSLPIGFNDSDGD